MRREAYVPTSQSAPAARPWISAADALQFRAQSAFSPPRQGSSASNGLRVVCCTRMPWADEPLRTKEAINRLFQEGVVYHGRHVLLMARRVPEGPRRVLFVASRRVGNAVRRNRAKRVMRAAYQRMALALATDKSHIGWIARASSAEQRMQVIETDMRELLGRARLIASREGAPGAGPQSQDDRT